MLAGTFFVFLNFAYDDILVMITHSQLKDWAGVQPNLQK